MILNMILQSLIAALAITESGDTLVNENSRNLMIPASNMKVLTTGTALHTLGGNYRWETAIGYSGRIEGSTLKGDIYIIGGGDPTIGAAVEFAEPLEDVLEAWTGIIAGAGIRRIDGHIIGDGRFFEGPMEDQTWLWEDLGTYYGAGVSGLSFFENRKVFRVTPGDGIGDPVSVEDGFPKTPWMEYSCDGASTGRPGTGDQLYLFTSRLAPVGELRGTFAQGKRTKDVQCSNKFPEYTCASYLAGYLPSKGIISTMGPAGVGSIFKADRTVPREEIRIIGRTKSPILAKVIRQTNVESDNFMAETLFRTMGRKNGGRGTMEESRMNMEQAVRSMGVDEPLSIRDGSGLSRMNLVSPAAFCSFLRKMMDSEQFPVFLSSLPVAGMDGTVRSRLGNLPPAQRSRVHMKSGSMEGVRCFCGYILPLESGANRAEGTVSGETVIFSFMVNNSTAPGAELNAEADRFISSLMGF